MYPSFRITEEVVGLPKKLSGGNITELPVEDKVHHIMQWLSAYSRVKSNTMLYMIMYDIENNRIRTNIAKYLIRKGCLRIQKSVYLAKSSPAVMREISETLKEINEIYENEDSIFVLPVPEEKFNNIKVIGRNIEFEVITSPRNVLFF
jgi:CRISPR-associated endonuclease Cas2